MTAEKATLVPAIRRRILSNRAGFRSARVEEGGIFPGRLQELATFDEVGPRQRPGT
jgi:hypothetical protein